MKIALFHAPLSRKGPGLLLDDIRKQAPQTECIAAIIADVAPDVLVLTQVDFDLRHEAISALSARIAEAGHRLDHSFTALTNAGVPSGHDLTGNGRTGDAGDAHGYGWFAGQGGMAVLSRWPVEMAEDLTPIRWGDMDSALVQPDDPKAETRRLSSDGHWVLTVRAPDPFHIMAFHATPPVFDGPEDLNGRRNHDEITLWRRYLDRPDAVKNRFVLTGVANIDPDQGEGRRGAIQALINDPRLTDPRPQGALPDHATVDWSDLGLGAMRVSYVLPSRDLAVAASGVHEPRHPCAKDESIAHRAVWVDVRLGP